MMLQPFQKRTWAEIDLDAVLNEGIMIDTRSAIPIPLLK
jgi:hypothetical protein